MYASLLRSRGKRLESEAVAAMRIGPDDRSVSHAIAAAATVRVRNIGCVEQNGPLGP
jgi:hypothetical protein